MDVAGRVADPSAVDMDDSRDVAGFGGIGIRSGVGMSSIPPHTRNRIAATVENERVPASQEPPFRFFPCSDGSGMLSASFNSRYRGSWRSASPLNAPGNAPGVEVKSGSRLPPAPSV